MNNCYITRLRFALLKSDAFLYDYFNIINNIIKIILCFGKPSVRFAQVGLADLAMFIILYVILIIVIIYSRHVRNRR